MDLRKRVTTLNKNDVTMEQGKELVKRKMKPRGGNSPVIGDNGVHTQPGDNAKYAGVLATILSWGDVDKGALVASFSTTPANTPRQFEVYDDYLVNGDGDYRISLFAQGEDGSWNDNYYYIPQDSSMYVCADGKPYLCMRGD